MVTSASGGAINSARVDLLVRHILATAALSDDFTQRRLGPIHFLKYIYLADLAFAKRNGGQSFTGADWRFYHFGPWSDAVFRQLPTALMAVGALEFQIPSRYEGDFVRYGLDSTRAEEIVRSAEDALPFVVASATARAVKEYGSDTADLLRNVYLTEPMLAARPGQELDLSVVASRATGSIEPVPSTTPAQFSKSQQRARAAIIATARQEIAKRLSAAKSRGAAAPPPRYDDVFREGTAHLDRLAGASPEPTSGELEFDESIWTSDQRRESDLP